MKKPLWAPWRLEYIVNDKKKVCPFCLPQNNSIPTDEELLVLYRGKTAFVIMNKFPYSNGHILVAPFRHIPDITLLTDEESSEIMSLLQKSTLIIRKILNPDGLNMGLNLGKSAGAGILEHIHFHIVPRWEGDTSFMATINDVSIIPEHIKATYGKLRILFNDLSTG